MKRLFSIMVFVLSTAVLFSACSSSSDSPAASSPPAANPTPTNIATSVTTSVEALDVVNTIFELSYDAIKTAGTGTLSNITVIGTTGTAIVNGVFTPSIFSGCSVGLCPYTIQTKMTATIIYQNYTNTSITSSSTSSIALNGTIVFNEWEEESVSLGGNVFNTSNCSLASVQTPINYQEYDTSNGGVSTDISDVVTFTMSGMSSWAANGAPMRNCTYGEAGTLSGTGSGGSLSYTTIKPGDPNACHNCESACSGIPDCSCCQVCGGCLE
ncbi:MAG: hypothetical protein WA946_14020 [Nitrospirota bacterium]